MGSNYHYLGNWDSQGVPEYLMEPDEISPELIQRMHVSLPEKGNVQNHSPHYLTNTHTRNLLIQTDNENFTGADVTVTFLTEGAGYRNVMGYYWYPLRNGYTVPTKLNDQTQQ